MISLPGEGIKPLTVSKKKKVSLETHSPQPEGLWRTVGETLNKGSGSDPWMKMAHRWQPAGYSQASALSPVNLLSNIKECFKHFTLKCQNIWWPNISHVHRRERWASYGGRDTIELSQCFTSGRVRKTHKQWCAATEGARCNQHTHSHTEIRPLKYRYSSLILGLLSQMLTCEETEQSANVQFHTH